MVNWNIPLSSNNIIFFVVNVKIIIFNIVKALKVGWKIANGICPGPSSSYHNQNDSENRSAMHYTDL